MPDTCVVVFPRERMVTIAAALTAQRLALEGQVAIAQLLGGDIRARAPMIETIDFLRSAERTFLDAARR